ncbi:metallophosphoesterase family protein [Empedobacter brevis]|uniref:metallophosphoesterase family protein n=1 Tax=Empedobacter brevis TaxID=247 RepID=UPI0039B0AD36
MKILHTADWHLGKKLDSFSRLEEQILVMNEVVEIADQEQVDLVLIAGDLFDNFNPSIEAVELFYKTLKRLSNNGKRPVVAIAGNHDSPSLIDAPDPLARECGIILIGYPNAKIQEFELNDFKISKSVEGMIELKLNAFDFPIRIIHTPYANEVRLKQYFGENKEDALNEVLATNWKNIANEYCDENGVNLLMAHLYMNKKGAELLEEPEGEKPIKIGNADMIFSEAIPSQIQYTALGHLHGFKNIGTEEKPVVYSSSPLCYSFSEAGQNKYVSIIEAGPNQNISYKKIELKNGKPLIRKTFDDINVAVQWLNENQDALVELTLESDSFLKADERKLIYQSHAGIIHLIPKIKNQEIETVEYKFADQTKDMKELFADYFKSKNGNQEPNDEIKELFNEILNGNSRM